VSQLFPALGGHQSIIVVSLSPDVMALDIRLVSFSISTPFPDLFGDRLGTELRQVWLYRLKRCRWEIP
jgi:hypothetical protein